MDVVLVKTLKLEESDSHHAWVLFWNCDTAIHPRDLWCRQDLLHLKCPSQALQWFELTFVSFAIPLQVLISIHSQGAGHWLVIGGCDVVPRETYFLFLTALYCITKGILATMAECQQCKSAEDPVLAGRTVQNIRHFVRNRGITLKRKTMSNWIYIIFYRGKNAKNLPTLLSWKSFVTSYNKKAIVSINILVSP